MKRLLLGRSWPRPMTQRASVASRASCLAIAALVLLHVAGCSIGPRPGGYYKDDGPGVGPPPVEVSRIPDAVPKPEQRSRGTNRPYTVMGRHYVPLNDARGYRERGVASWYGQKFHGRKTANGETYDMYAMSAAHKTLPLPSYVRVRNLENGRSAVVRVNDRGPFLHNRLIDLSYAAASKLGIAGTGTGLVEVEVIEPGTSVASGESANGAAEQDRKPTVEVIPPATVPTTPPAVDGKPRLFVQVGAFQQWDNATVLRTRLERAGLRPIFIQSVQLSLPTGTAAQRIYRVRIGPLANVEAADRLTQTLATHDVADATIVVE